MKSKTAWYDNNHEGKALRRIFNKMLARFEKLARDENSDTDQLIRLAHNLSIIASNKANLGKFEIVDKKLNQLLTLLKEQQPKRFIADNYSGELPRPEDTGIGATTCPAEETSTENTQ